MSKTPKRPVSGKKPPVAGGRRNERIAIRGDDRNAGPPDRSSKRGSFRKREQDDPRKAGARKAEPRSDSFKDSRAPQKIPPRPVRDPGKKRFEDVPREPKTARLNADLFGFHAVREAWQNPKRYVHALYVTESALKELGDAIKTSAKRPAPTVVTKDQIDKAFPPGTVHQGIALSCQPLAEASVMDIIIRGTEKPHSVVVVLDQVTDPHNIGAIMRSACAFGADGIVMQTRHAPDTGGILAKTACGAAEHVPVAYETNLSRAIEKLQEHHYTVIGLDEHAQDTFGTLRSYDRVVIVLGAEGTGMRRMVKEHCDVLVTLPTKPPIASLNVSNAAAVALYALTKH